MSEWASVHADRFSGANDDEGDVAVETKTDTPSREQVESLKSAWVSDPIWPIEDTEGFEAYRDELRAFSEKMDAKWEAEKQQRLIRKADELGVPFNLKLAQYVINLEARIAAMQREIDRIESWGGA